MSHFRHRALFALGVLLVVVAILLPVVLRATAFTYPGPFRDTTIDATGTASVLADLGTLAPLPQPLLLPLHVQRHVHTVDTDGDTVVVDREDAHSVDNLAPLRLVQRYTVDDRSLRNVAASTPAFAYTPSEAVDRAPAYSVAFPFGADAGPYPVWNDEAGQAVAFTQTGPATVDGRTLLRYRGTLDHADLTPALAAKLTAVALPSTTTYAGLQPRLMTAGVDTGLLDTVAREEGAHDAESLVSSFGGSSIPLTYELTSDVQLLVEPRTGTIVSLDRIDETLAARPDVTGIGRLYALLKEPGDPNTLDDRTVAAAAIAKLLSAPPTTPVLTESYTQTPDSVAAVAGDAGRWADQILAWTIVVPIVLAVLGLALCLVALLRTRRRRRPVPSGE